MACRPSQIIGIQSPLVQWDFDAAIILFGTFVENEVGQVRLSESDRKFARDTEALLSERRMAKMHYLLDIPGAARSARHITSLDDLRRIGEVIEDVPVPIEPPPLGIVRVAPNGSI